VFIDRIFDRTQWDGSHHTCTKLINSHYTLVPIHKSQKITAIINNECKEAMCNLLQVDINIDTVL